MDLHRQKFYFVHSCTVAEFIDVENGEIINEKKTTQELVCQNVKTPGLPNQETYKMVSKNHSNEKYEILFSMLRICQAVIDARGGQTLYSLKMLGFLKFR